MILYTSFSLKVLEGILKKYMFLNLTYSNILHIYHIALHCMPLSLSLVSLLKEKKICYIGNKSTTCEEIMPCIIYINRANFVLKSFSALKRLT